MKPKNKKPISEAVSKVLNLLPHDECEYEARSEIEPYLIYLGKSEDTGCYLHKRRKVPVKGPWIEKPTYFPDNWTWNATEIRTHSAMFDLLKNLRPIHEIALLINGPNEDWKHGEIKTKDNQTCQSTYDHIWGIFDIDGKKHISIPNWRPVWSFKQTASAIFEYLAEQLPGVDWILCFSSSAGDPAKDGPCVRLICMLDEPKSTYAIKAFAKSQGWDTSIYNASRLIYTSDPVLTFEPFSKAKQRRTRLKSERIFWTGKERTLNTSNWSKLVVEETQSFDSIEVPIPNIRLFNHVLDALYEHNMVIDKIWDSKRKTFKYIIRCVNLPHNSSTKQADTVLWSPYNNQLTSAMCQHDGCIELLSESGLSGFKYLANRLIEENLMEKPILSGYDQDKSLKDIKKQLKKRWKDMKTGRGIDGLSLKIRAIHTVKHALALGMEDTEKNQRALVSFLAVHTNKPSETVEKLVTEYLKSPVRAKSGNTATMSETKLIEHCIDLAKDIDEHISYTDLKSGEELLGYMVRFFSLRICSNKTVISRFFKNHKGRMLLEEYTVEALKTFAKNKPIWRWDKKKPASADNIPVNPVDILLRADKRRSIEELVFDPTPDIILPKSKLNLWTGWAVEQQGSWRDCKLFLWHLRYVICDGDKVRYRYLLRWIAHIIQTPQIKTSVCPIIIGEQGTGKTLLWDYVLKMFGPHGKSFTATDRVTSNFNILLAYQLLVVTNEVIFARDNKQANTLKGLLTDLVFIFEKKGVDAFELDNCINMVSTTNEDHAAQVPRDDRRFFVTRANTRGKDICKEAGNRDYWNNLGAEMKGNGPAGLLSMLSQINLDGFYPQDFPQTSARLEQQIETAKMSDPVISLIHDAANAGVNPCTVELDRYYSQEQSWSLDKPLTVIKKDLRLVVEIYRKKQNVYKSISDHKISSTLKDLFQAKSLYEISTRTRVDGPQERCWIFPPLRETRQLIENWYNGKIDWEPIFPPDFISARTEFAEFTEISS